MHGIIFAELKNYVDTKVGGDAWQALRSQAGVTRPGYLVTETYPDAELVALVQAGSKATGTPVPALLEDFGLFIVPALVTVYRPYIRPEWKALDLLEGTEQHIHRAVRLKDPGADPPRLRAERVSPDEVRITYTSPRRLCAVARGIARGVLAHYNQQGTVRETSCMHRGEPQCVISVKTI